MPVNWDALEDSKPTKTALDEALTPALETGGKVNWGALEESKVEVPKEPDFWNKFVLEDKAGKTLVGMEMDLAAKYDLLYPLARTIADFVPGAKYLFPSAREEYMRMTTKEQTIDGILESLGMVPILVVGKGIKYGAKGIYALGKGVGKGAAKVGEKTPFRLPAPKVKENPWADKLLQDIPHYVHEDLSTKLIRRYDLEPDELRAVYDKKPWVWRPVGRSGAMVPTRTHALKQVFSDAGNLKKPVRDNIKKWSQPAEVQRTKHYQDVTERVFRDHLKGKKYEPEALLEATYKRLYGELPEEGIKFTDLGMDEIGNLLADTFAHGTKLTRMLDISSLALWKPVRKVYGQAGLWKTFQQPLLEVYRATTRTQTQHVQKFHMILANKTDEAGKPLLEIVEKKTGPKIIEHYSKGEWKEAGELAMKLDSLQAQGKTPETLQFWFNQASPKAQKIVEALHEWYDHMYAEYVSKKIPLLFKEAGATLRGQSAIERMMYGPNGIASQVSKIMGGGANLDYMGKLTAMKRLLRGVREEVLDNVEKGGANWFIDEPLEALDDATRKEFRNRMRKLLQELKYREGKGQRGFLNYLENYAARIPERGGLRRGRKITTKIPEEMHGAFTKERMLIDPEGITTDLQRMVSSRARSQAKELEFYPHLPWIREATEQMPEHLKAFSQLYVNRLLGNPAAADRSVANFLSRYSRMDWDDRRLQFVARKINDLVYLGGLGFKPFSAMRNWFQPLLLVPADMGGVKDIAWLGRGYYRAFKDKGTREFIREIGAIQEYAPDISFRLKVSKFSDKTTHIRDMGLWMFKQSEHHCRYVTGAAAMEKWEWTLRKISGSKDGVLRKAQIENFAKKVNLKSREKWIQEEIREGLESGTAAGMKKAKAAWVNDVIADTQYIYGVEESPLIMYRYGSLGRMSLVFQTWWMNYGSALAKWMFRTEGVAPKAERLFTFMLTGAISYQIMKHVWGEESAARNVLFGPFPQRLELPVTWGVLSANLELLFSLFQAPITGDPGAIASRAKAALRTSMIMTPFGLQGWQMYRGYRKEGEKGLLKSIIKYRGPREEE